MVEASLAGASEREPLDPLLGPAVEEHVNGASARRERGGRDERPEYRIFVVLPHGEDPHIDAVCAHDGRQVQVEPLLEPPLLHRRLLAERSKRPVGGDLGGGREDGQGDEGAEQAGHYRHSVMG